MKTPTSEIRLLPLTLLILLPLVSGCEDDESIVSALLDREVEDSDNGNNGASLQPGRVPNYEESYDGLTDAAQISSEEREERLITDTAFLLWHFARLQQGMDRMVRILTENDEPDLISDPLQDGWKWQRAFQAANCGASDDIEIIEEGSSGRVSFGDACFERMELTDGTTLKMDGDLTWESARIVDPQTGDATRKIQFGGVQLRWRDNDYTLSGATEVEEGSNTVFSGLDVVDEERNKTYRFLAESTPDAGTGSAMEFIYHSELGGVEQTRSGGTSFPEWLNQATDCGGADPAVTGTLQITEPDYETDFRVELSCDQYNILDGVDANGNTISSSPATLLEAL